MTPWWQQTVADVAAALATSETGGLSAAEAAARQQRFGPNQLQEQESAGPLALFLEQFKNFIVWVLIGAALVSGFLGEWVDTAAIVAIVILNALLGFFQEFRAEKALAALKKMASPFSKAMRDGQQRLVPAADLVPGDLIELEAGDHVPADARVTWHTANFAVQEASLTGESQAVAKQVAVIAKADLPLGDRANILYLGTAVTAGKARALVVETGMQTELGKIAGLLQATKTEATPLQQRLAEFGRWLVYLCGILVTIVFALNLWRGTQVSGGLNRELLVETFLTSVSLAVAAIPEGLPAVVTIALALGLQRMVRRHALIRKLPSVETLGSASVICSDKTGTLTRNEMTVQAAFAGGRSFTVEGVGYAPTGRFLDGGQAVDPDQAPDLIEALRAGLLCNGARLTATAGQYQIVGDPTEAALLTAAAKAGLNREAEEADHGFVDEIPFDSERKLMTVVRHQGPAWRAWTKGAPDVLLQRATSIREHGQTRPLTDADRQALLRANDAFADQALRVLAVACRDLPTLPTPCTAAAVEQDLVFLGFVAMMDPPRAEVRHAIAACKTAGIRTVMITGDHKNTAVAIARALGFFDDQSLALTGAELDRLDDRAFGAVIERVPVYARVAPEHKLRIVREWRRRGHVVAMTGDGVNDAPAVKEADIGVAMGITGTDVTKEVADMVVTDDNFASIVAAVEEGRGIYSNIQKFIHYLLSCNAGEIMVMFLASLIGMPVPLLPVQILWVNLVTDGLPALALGVDPVNPNLMRRPPRDLHEPVVSGRRLALMLGQGLVIAGCCLAAFAFIFYLEDRHPVGAVARALFAFDWDGLRAIFTVPPEQRELLLGKARSMAFVVLAFSQDFHSYNCRSQTLSLFQLGVFSNKKLIAATMVSMTLNAMAIYTPFFQHLLKTQPLTAGELGIVVLAASTPFWVMELYKLGRRLVVAPDARGR